MSNQGPAVIHFEVYTFESQRWTLHARFRRDEKDEALEEAKQIERSLGRPAKVVRETYYPANNVCEETLVYASDKALRAKAAATSLAIRGGGRGGYANAADPGIPEFRLEEPRKAPPASSMEVLVKLALIIAGALAVAGAVTGVVNAFIAKMPEYHVAVSPETASLLSFLAFVLAFLCTAVPLAMSAIDWQGVTGSQGPAKQPPRAPAAPPPKRKTAVKAKPAETPQKPAPPPAPEELDAEDELDWEGLEDEDLPLPPFEEALPIAPLPDPEAAQKEGQEEEKEKAQAQEATAGQQPQAEDLDSYKMSMIRFLSGLLSEVKRNRPTLDAYNKFGIDLVLAGAVEVLGTQRSLEIEDKREILKNVLEVMGTKADTARAFADKYEDYLVEPRYMAMVQAGRTSMEAFMAGSEPDPEQLGAVFEGWNKPHQTTQAAPRIMTILFTDMVGSTDLTQARGDQAAQDIVRRHNSIVRAALAEFTGKEIKHTGDGIMASFASAAHGVEAAIAIQRAVASHNSKRPEQPLHLRIGMNAGEPIEEEDDLFGGTVQLAARVCAKSGTDEILCTNVVRELSAGKGLAFAPRGAHELKGFKDPVPLYGVLWDAKAIASLGADSEGSQTSLQKPAAKGGKDAAKARGSKEKISSAGA